MKDSVESQKRTGVKRRLVVIGVVILLLIIVLLSVVVLLGIKKNNSKSDDTTLDADASEEFMEYDDISGVYSVEKVDFVDVVNDTAESEKDLEGKRKVYLTFDDGPSVYTNRILDILDKYNVKATFFVIAKDDEISEKAYKRIVDEGHTLAMHSFDHRYNVVYKSEDSFKSDVSRLQEFLYDKTGVWSRIYRFPGGSSNTVSAVSMDKLINYLNDVDITYFDWNIESGDAVAGRVLSEQTIIYNCTSKIGKYDECVILMHDSYDRPTTVSALDDIIENILARGDSVILPITDDTIPVQHKAIKE